MDPTQPLPSSSQTPADGCEYSPRLGAFQDGELDAAAERIIERHLASCQACRLELQDIRELSWLASEIGLDGISPPAVRRIHRAIEGDQRHVSIFHIAGVLTGLAASALVVGGAWLWDVQDSSNHAKHIVVHVNPVAANNWEYLAVNLRPDPLPTAPWEVSHQQMMADARFSSWMLEGLSGSGR